MTNVTAPDQTVGVDNKHYSEDGELLYSVVEHINWPTGAITYIESVAEHQKDNLRRAAFVAPAVQAQVDATYGGDAEFEPVRQVVGDLLANLMHYADALGLDFDDVLVSARNLYSAEVTDFTTCEMIRD